MLIITLLLLTGCTEVDSIWNDLNYTAEEDENCTSHMSLGGRIVTICKDKAK